MKIRTFKKRLRRYQSVRDIIWKRRLCRKTFGFYLQYYTFSTKEYQQIHQTSALLREARMYYPVNP